MENFRLFEYLYRQYNEYPLEKSIGQKVNGEWQFYSTQQLVEYAEKLAAGLLRRGYQKGDKISIVSYKNRPEWVVVDMATQMLGIVNVPLYPTISAGEYVYILNDAEVKACFAGSGDLVEKLNDAQKDVASLKEIFCFESDGGGIFWESIFSEDGIENVKAIAETVDSSDLVTLIYTSGTTGKPKGVMLTHQNIHHVIECTGAILHLEKNEKVLSFLPFCHIFERAVIYAYLNKGVSVYCTGTDNLGGESGDLATVKPHFFTTVPRLLEKVYEKIYNKGLDLTGLKKKLFFWALSLTDDYEHGKTYSGMDAYKRKIADKLIFSKWRDALGGNLKGLVTGAAPMPAKIARVFSAAGIPVMEGYGLTETSPTLTVNNFDGDALIGSVGVVVDGVEIMIDSDGDYREGEGEILAHGPNIMQGYYNKPEETAKVMLDIDGKRWFRTGDVGKFIDGPNGKQYLKITDRKKELLKTSGGKYVAPAPIEGKMKEDFLVEQIMVIGDQRKFVSALILPAEEALRDHCDTCGIEWTGIENMVNHPKVLEAYQKVIDNVNKDLSKIEQIKKFSLINASWEAVRTDGTDAELTPTMKLKRRVVREKYAKHIDAIYAE